MDKDYYYTEQEWAKMVGYGPVPTQRQESISDEQHWNGEQQLNKSTGQVEVYYNGMWTAR
jgi:hypothetical protein